MNIYIYLPHIPQYHRLQNRQTYIIYITLNIFESKNHPELYMLCIPILHYYWFCFILVLTLAKYTQANTIFSHSVLNSGRFYQVPAAYAVLRRYKRRRRRAFSSLRIWDFGKALASVYNVNGFNSNKFQMGIYGHQQGLL